MSEVGDRAKLEFVLSVIDDLEKITARHKGVSLAMKDVEGKHAVLMCILQIGEKLNQIEDEDIRDKLPIAGAYSMRNFIAHDYGGIDLLLVKNTIRYNIPELKEILEALVDG